MATPVGSPSHGGLTLRPHGPISTSNTSHSNNHPSFSQTNVNSSNFVQRPNSFGYIIMDEMPNNFGFRGPNPNPASASDQGGHVRPPAPSNPNGVRVSYSITRGSNQPLTSPPTSPPGDLEAMSSQRTQFESNSSSSSSSSSAATSPEQEAPAPVISTAQKRKPIEGDCSICWEPFEEKVNELLYCKTTCGNNFHKKCFVEWLVTPKHQRAGPDLKCPYCRGPWEANELRQLQIDNGIIPPRPFKRSRPDVTSPIRREQRDMQRRLYRERANSRQMGTMIQHGAPRYQTQPRPVSYRPSTSLPSPPSTPSTAGSPATAQGPQQVLMSPYDARNQIPRTYPAYPQAQQMPYNPHQQQRPSNPPSYMHAPYMSYAMQMPLSNTSNTPTMSHDLNAPGYTMPPTMSPNAYSQPRMYSPFEPTPSRCPAMQAQMSPYANPQMLNLQPQVQFCPGSAASFEFQQYHLHQTYTFYTGTQFP